MQFSRYHRLLRAWIATVLLVAGWGVPLALPHLSDDDLLCRVAIGPTGDARPQVEAAGVRTAPEHCVICHAARAFRASLDESPLVATDLLPGAVLLLPPQTVHVRSTFGRLPARAPPLA